MHTLTAYGWEEYCDPDDELTDEELERREDSKLEAELSREEDAEDKFLKYGK